MNSILIPEYVSEDSFRIYDWMNETLLLRSQGSIFIGGDIDLIFWGIKYVELPLVLHGVQITKPRDKQALEYEQRYSTDQFAELGEKTYAISSQGYRFHVLASNFWIHINTSHRAESSLPYLLDEDSTRREFYISDSVKEWYKLA